MVRNSFEMFDITNEGDKKIVSTSKEHDFFVIGDEME